MGKVYFLSPNSESNSDTKESLARMEGLARLLKQQSNLTLAFLNGCSTEKQVLPLIECEIPVVIATSKSIDDAAATSIAHGFYEALSQKSDLQSAFEKSESRILSSGGADYA